MPADRGKTDRRDCEIKQEQEKKDDISVCMEAVDPGHGGLYRPGNGIRNAARGKRIRRFLGDRHERVYLRRIDAVCGDRSDNGRCVPDLGGAYDTYGQCAAFILRDLHGGTVQRYEAV